jgi:hypothetical protein
MNSCDLTYEQRTAVELHAHGGGSGHAHKGVWNAVTLCVHALSAVVLVSIPLTEAGAARLDARQKIVADVWRTTDRLFYDRSVCICACACLCVCGACSVV